MLLNEAEFVVNVKGGTSGESYIGKFKVRKMLSHNGYLKQDQIRRDLLGKDPANASQRAIQTALIFSTVWPHIIEAPSFWKENDNGLELVDDEPISEVFNKITDLVKELQASKVKAGEDAKAKVKEEIKEEVKS